MDGGISREDQAYEGKQSQQARGRFARPKLARVGRRRLESKMGPHFLERSLYGPTAVTN